MCLPAGGTSDEWRHLGEAAYYVLSGSGWFEDRATGARHEVRAGLIAHVAAGTPYVMRAREPLVCVGGSCSPDPSLYAAVPPTRRRAAKRSGDDPRL